MKTITRAFGSVVVFFAAIPPVTAAAGTRHDGAPGFYGYDAWSPYAHPPVPPADIPNVRPFKNNISARRAPPLPRARPNNFATRVRESAPNAQSQPHATLPLSPSDGAPVATSRPVSPAMVPVAPLE